MNHRDQHGSPAEFDAYSKGYESNLDHPLRRLFANQAIEYIELKVEWLLRDLARRPLPDGANRHPRFLDYGCGTGSFLRSLRVCGFDAELCGCDVSAGMLEEADRQLAGAPVHLAPMESSRGPYPDASFDLIVSAGVFHHIRPEARSASFRDVQRLLRPAGRCYVFEHNPFNPLARWVVRSTPLDADAVLLTPQETRRSMEEAGFVDLKTDHLMFFPPRLRQMRPIEDRLRWLPIGAQYVVSGSR